MTTPVVTVFPGPMFILVHGGWHGAWAWHKLVPLLRDRDLWVAAPDMPGQGFDTTPLHTITLDHYVQRIAETAQLHAGPVILVGHSSGGIAIAQAAELLGPQKVAALVFLDAFMPQNGESVFSLVAKFPMAPDEVKGAALAASMHFAADGKSTTLDMEKVAALLYHDCSEADITFAKRKLGPQPLSTQATPVQLSEERYGTIPKYYILCNDARDFDKKRIATNVPTVKSYSLPSSHSPFFSMPHRLADILQEIHRFCTNRTVKA